MSRFPSLATMACLTLLSLSVSGTEVQAGGWYSPCGSYSYSFWSGCSPTVYGGYCGTSAPYCHTASYCPTYAASYCPTYAPYCHTTSYCPTYTASYCPTYTAPVCYSSYRPVSTCYLSAPYSVGYYSPWCPAPYPAYSSYGSYRFSYGYGGYGYPSYGCRW